MEASEQSASSRLFAKNKTFTYHDKTANIQSLYLNYILFLYMITDNMTICIASDYTLMAKDSVWNVI